MQAQLGDLHTTFMTKGFACWWWWGSMTHNGIKIRVLESHNVGVTDLKAAPTSWTH